MTDADKNRRIYECLREVYILTHTRDESELFGERSEPSGEVQPKVEFDPLGVNTLEEFSYSPSLFKPHIPKEDVTLP